MVAYVSRKERQGSVDNETMEQFVKSGYMIGLFVSNVEVFG